MFLEMCKIQLVTLNLVWEGIFNRNNFGQNQKMNLVSIIPTYPKISSTLVTTSLKYTKKRKKEKKSEILIFLSFSYIFS